MTIRPPSLPNHEFHEWRERHEEANRKIERNLNIAIRNVKAAICLAVVADAVLIVRLVEKLT